MNSNEREAFWYVLKDSVSEYHLQIKHRVSQNFGDEYVMITITQPRQDGVFEGVHITLWKKPWVNNGAFHFVSGMQRSERWKQQLYGTFKLWYSCTIVNSNVHIEPYSGRDVRNNTRKTKSPTDPRYLKYKSDIENLRKEYFEVIKDLVTKYGSI